jgi:hypothetical protein
MLDYRAYNPGQSPFSHGNSNSARLFMVNTVPARHLTPAHHVGYRADNPGQSQFLYGNPNPARLSMVNTVPMRHLTPDHHVRLQSL